MAGSIRFPKDVNSKFVLPLICIFGCIAFTSGKAVHNGEEIDPTFIETVADEFEGDMILDDNDGFRNMIQDVKRWPNGVVVYAIDQNHTAPFKERIRKAMDVIEAAAPCIKFKLRTNEKGYVLYRPGKGGCSSGVGYTKRKQHINLGKGCGGVATIIHETLHTLGFFHEQSRPDRDSYVTIMWENIKKGRGGNFGLKTNSRTLDTPYDYGSVMHYGGKAFTANKKPTIVAKDDPTRKLGQRKGLSALDILKLNKLYGCKKVD